MKLLEILNKVIYKFYKKPTSRSMKNVLVVSNTALGDTILSTPAIKTLRINFPEIKITFMLNKQYYPLFEDFEYVDYFIFYKKGFFNQLQIVKEIKKRNIDTIFLFHSNGPEDMFFSIMSGAKILKFTDKENHEYKEIFFNKIKKDTRHVIDKKISLVECFDIKKYDKRLEIGKKFYLPKTIHNKLKIGFQVGAANIFKMWPIERFIELAKKLENEYEVEFILFGNGEVERELNNKFEKNVKVKNLCCKTNIEELAFNIRDLDLLITNDTGTMHLAIALDVPTIELFSATDSTQIGAYYNDIHRIIQKNGDFVNNKPKKQRSNEAMKLINVDEVFDVTKNLIKDLYEDTFSKK